MNNEEIGEIWEQLVKINKNLKKMQDSHTILQNQIIMHLESHLKEKKNDNN